MEDEGNTVCIDKYDKEILVEFNRRQYVTFRCCRLLAKKFASQIRFMPTQVLCLCYANYLVR